MGPSSWVAKGTDNWFKTGLERESETVRSKMSPFGAFSGGHLDHRTLYRPSSNREGEAGKGVEAGAVFESCEKSVG
jgi:hypothetical protein